MDGSIGTHKWMADNATQQYIVQIEYKTNNLLYIQNVRTHGREQVWCIAYNIQKVADIQNFHLKYHRELRGWPLRFLTMHIRAQSAYSFYSFVFCNIIIIVRVPKNIFCFHSLYSRYAHKHTHQLNRLWNTAFICMCNFISREFILCS